MEAYLLSSLLAVPEAEAGVVDRERAALHLKSCLKLVAVAEIVPVAAALIVKADASRIGKRASVHEKRMQIAKEVSAARKSHADLNACNSHIGKGIIVSVVHENAYRILLVVTYDIYGVYIRVRRAAVCTSLYMYAYLRVLDRHVADRGLTSALNSDTVSHHIAVDDTAVEVVVASVGINIVIRLSRAESHDSLAAAPIRRRLENCVVGEVERYAVYGISRGSYRLCNNILTVGEIYRLVGIVVDYLLYLVRKILARIRLEIIGYYDISL